MFVAFANQYITGGNVFNIFITKEFLNEKDDENGRELLMNNVMEAFFSQMIVYMEKNIETVRSAIRKKRHTNDYSSEPFYAAYEIVGQFWQTEGIDFVQKAGLPTSVDFTWLFEDSLDNDEELMQLFIKAVRKNIQHFKGVEKNSRSKYMLYAIYYNETYLWFPTKVLKKILGHECLKPDMTKILFMLKRDSNLIADTDGFTRKLQIEGTLFETYQIKRDLFNQDGMADIINLTKESEKC
jgi:hypothetical protein